MSYERRYAPIKHRHVVEDIDDFPATIVESWNGRTGAVVPEQADYDSFFLTQTEGDTRYVEVAGDTMTGTLISETSTTFATVGSGLNGIGIANSGSSPVFTIFELQSNAGQLLTVYNNGRVDIPTGNITIAGTVDGRDVSVDGTKLDTIATGAEVNTIDSFNGRTGAVVPLQADYDGFFLTPAEGNAAYLGISATAADSNELGGVAAANYARTDIAETFGGNVQVNGEVISNELRCRTNQQLVLNAGESTSYSTGQTSKFVYINAENGLAVTSSPDNWASGWAGRNASAIINDASANSSFPGNISVVGTVDGRDVATDGTKLDGIASGAEVNPAVVSQAEAEAGTATTERIWTAQRVSQAIAAQAVSGPRVEFFDALDSTLNLSDTAWNTVGAITLSANTEYTVHSEIMWLCQSGNMEYRFLFTQTPSDNGNLYWRSGDLGTSPIFTDGSRETDVAAVVLVDKTGAGLTDYMLVEIRGHFTSNATTGGTVTLQVRRTATANQFFVVKRNSFIRLYENE